MSRYKPKNHWNYRIVTKLLTERTGHDINKGTHTNLPDERLFSIVEVYYHYGKPDSYADSLNILKDHESVEDLKWVRKKIKKAFKRPILDLDNWPAEFKK
jgi:hypothetical protein